MRNKNKKFKESYARDLENQIKEHAQKEKVTFNEMDERSLTLNQKGLLAYETGERNTGLFKLPGVDASNADKRENFARYARNKPIAGSVGPASNQFGAGDTMSIRSNRPTMNEIMTTLPFAQNKYKDVPKTSMDESHNRYRRGSRGANSPANEYYAQYPLTDREPMKQANGLSKFKSMADLTLNNANGSRDLADDSKMFSPNKVQAGAAGLLADSQFKSKLLPPPDKPEYEPTKRDVAERRVINDAGLSRSIQALPTQQVSSNCEHD